MVKIIIFCIIQHLPQIYPHKKFHYKLKKNFSLKYKTLSALRDMASFLLLYGKMSKGQFPRLPKNKESECKAIHSNDLN